MGPTQTHSTLGRHHTTLSSSSVCSSSSSTGVNRRANKYTCVLCDGGFSCAAARQADSSYVINCVNGRRKGGGIAPNDRTNFSKWRWAQRQHTTQKECRFVRRIDGCTVAAVARHNWCNDTEPNARGADEKFQYTRKKHRNQSGTQTLLNSQYFRSTCTPRTDWPSCCRWDLTTTTIHFFFLFFRFRS